MTPTGSIASDRTLADLAVLRPGAARVFHRHGLDFCCHGRESLAAACARRGLAVDDVVAELEREGRASDSFERWDEADPTVLIEHLLAHYHEGHRAELPRLIEMAEKVERVHAERAECPRGLTEHLRRMAESLELHMQKEEQVLFPLIRAGRGRMAGMPIQIMEEEHHDHGENLARMRGIAHDFSAPEGACPTWQALYLALGELERELMMHIHLENNVLFPRVLRG